MTKTKLLTIFGVTFAIAILAVGSVAPAAIAGNTVNSHFNGKSAVASTPPISFVFVSDDQSTAKGTPATHSSVAVIITAVPPCFDVVVLGTNDFKWSMGKATLNTPSACGPVNVTWNGQGPVQTQHNSVIIFGDPDCNDITVTVASNGKTRAATATGTIGVSVVNDPLASISHGVNSFKLCTP